MYLLNEVYYLAAYYHNSYHNYVFIFFQDIVNIDRLKQLNSTCSDLLSERRIFHGKQRDALYANLWYNDEMGVVICSAGGYMTHRFAYFWVKLQNSEIEFENFFYDYLVMKSYNFRSIDSLDDKDEQFDKIEKYKKILAVAHPLDRVLLTYRENQYGPEDFPFNDMEHFQEFLDILTTSYMLDRSEWMPVNSACMPCVIPYNFIVRAESMDIDLIRLLQEDHLESKFQNNTDRFSGTIIRDVAFQDITQLHGRKWPKHHKDYQGIKPVTMEKLRDAYNMDMKLFKYV